MPENQSMKSLISMAFILLAAVMEAFPDIFDPDDFQKKRKRATPASHLPRKRAKVESIFKNKGAVFMRRAYRMDECAFWQLHALLLPELEPPVPLGHNRTSHNGAKNGRISSELRLSAALRYFAGGVADDIADTHGISYAEVFKSVWLVVDAIHKTDTLRISFPTNHNKQKQMAAEFKKSSRAGFDNCVAAIDGMLIWMLKPCQRDCTHAECGAKKFFCGRKKKFGLNMQAACDARNRFVDVSIFHPAATSDYLAFTTSDLFAKLEEPGFLAPGLCIFGDNAYPNTAFMATPFKGVSAGSEDDYNFYHSQLRIKIECAFGILVHRWGILRKPMPFGISVKKTASLVVALCALHNFCIDQKCGKYESLAGDNLAIAVGGGFQNVTAIDAPESLWADNDDAIELDGEEDPSLPRQKLLNIVKEGNYKRPRASALRLAQQHN